MKRGIKYPYLIMICDESVVLREREIGGGGGEEREIEREK